MEGRCSVRWLILILIAGLAQPNSALGKSDSGPIAANHQILPDFEADPSARVFHGRLYVYPSHDVAGSKDWDMIDWHVFSTVDMLHWKDHGMVFSLKDIGWADKHAWAPDCIERNGRYYFYFPADDKIGVAVSDSPTGPFTEFKERWWLFYHVAGPSPYERRVCVAPLHYDKDGNILPVPDSDLCRNHRS